MSVSHRAKPVLDLIFAFRRSKVLFTATKLGVFEYLQSAGNSSSAHKIAKDLKLNEDGTERLLSACASLDLLLKDPKSNTFSLSPLSKEFLLESSDYPLTGYIHHSNEVLFKLWEHLEDSVKSGRSCWEEAFSGNKDEVFANLYKDDIARRRFTSAMHSFATLSGNDVVTAFSLDEFSTLVDLGGSTGALAVAALRNYPKMKGVVVELPSVLESTKEYLSKVEVPVRSRVELHAADFFKDKIPSGDLYVLSRIIHDWDIEKSRKLLSKIFNALPNNGALLIVEALVDEDKTGPEASLLQSLNMLVQTDGRERTLTEYRELLEGVGFSDVQGKKTGNTVDAILARKVSK